MANMDRGGRLRNRLTQARAFKMPSLLAYMGELRIASEKDVKPLLAVATEDVLDKAHVASSLPFCTWLSRAPISKALAGIWGAYLNIHDEDKLRARQYGELMGIMPLTITGTIAERDQARAEIIKCLAGSPPSLFLFSGYFKHVLTQCRQAPVGMATPTEIRCYVPDPPVAVSIQTMVFYRFKGHVIPCTMLKGDNLRDLWKQLCDVSIDQVDLEEVSVEIEDDCQVRWQDAGADSILGFYEALAEKDTLSARGTWAAAIFTYAIALCETQSSISRDWLFGRVRHYKDLYAGLPIEDKISVSTIKHYIAMYRQNVEIDTAIAYKQLVLASTNFKDEGVGILTWVVKQAMERHLSLFMAFAESVSRLNLFNVDYIIAAGVPRTQIHAVVKLAMHLLRNKLSTIIRLPVVLSNYADLAFLGLIFKTEVFQDKHFKINTTHAHGINGKTILSRTVATQVATDLYQHSHTPMARKETQAEMGAAIFKEKDEAPPAYQVLEPVNKEEAIERAQWPQKDKKLPPGTVQTSQTSVITLLREQMTDESKALLMIMQAVVRAQNQQPMPYITDSAANLPMTDEAITDALAEAAEKWGFTVPLDWKQRNRLVTPVAETGFILAPRRVNPTNVRAVQG